MLKTSTINKIQASENLGLTLSARATLAVILCATSVQLHAAQAGRQFGSNNNQPQHSSSPHVNYASPASKTTSTPATHPSAPATHPSAPVTHPSAPVTRTSAPVTPARPTPVQPARPTPTSNSSQPLSGRNGGHYPNPSTPTAPQTPSTSGWNRSTPNNIPSPGGRTTSITRVTNTTTYVNNGFHGREHGFDEPKEHSRSRVIPETHFREHFGREHEFHVTRDVMLSGYRHVQFGGVYFGVTQAWPIGWMPTDAVYIDYVGGSYMLCNRMHPGVRIPVTIDDCASCQTASDPLTASAPSCSECATQSNNDTTPTLSRGQSIADVVAILGTPTSAIDLGSKQIYLYQNMKVVFIDGRMSDVI